MNCKIAKRPLNFMNMVFCVGHFQNGRLPFKLKTKERWHEKWIKLTVETMVKDFFSIKEKRLTI